ncbi:cell division protein FtsQ/DivIB [Pantanalinema rosaneae CENA516]|uniref:cell division protein FtsQ/DivIB n=1 Tax=Pantanalinema rosaneae TaxID=1620701 RepID=UPI003D6F1A62
MTSSIAPVSQTELAQRRQKLRRQRRAKLFQAIWRVLAVFGLAGGLIWLSTQPFWLIRQADQIKVEGNRFIPVQRIRSLLPITYPQSLFRLEPQKIAKELKAKAPISDVIVSRQLFPPSLSIQIKERYPVAIALPDPNAKPSSAKSNQDNASTQVGLIDETGWWIPLENYTSVDRSVKLPTLKIIGRQEHYRSFWSKLYREVSRSPVKISEIDCQNPANIILKTELGTVHLGPPGSQLAYQIKTLDRMRQLPNQINPSQIAYIDLRNPDSPILQMVGTKDSQ